MKKTGWVLAILLMLGVGALGGVNATDVLRTGTTALQLSVGWAQVAYCIFGVLGGIGLARRRPWSATVSAAWSVCGAWAASVASFAFHDPTMSQPGTLVGVVGSGVSVLGVGALVYVIARANAPRAQGDAQAMKVPERV